jgi:hypothetical protein
MHIPETAQFEQSYRVKSAQWRDKQERSERDIDRYRMADASCADQGIQIFKRLRMLTAYSWNSQRRRSVAG